MPKKAPPAHIYVSTNLRHLATALVGVRTWWCVEKNTPPGELGVLYINQQGIHLVFRVIGRAPRQEFICFDHGLIAADIEIVARAVTPISAQTMREHAVLRKLPALVRSFQRKSFRLDEPFFSEILVLVAGKKKGTALAATV